jgi:hypothetical protein
MSGSIPATPQYQSADPATNQSQGGTSKAIQQLSQNPLNGGSLLTAISLKSGSNNVPHKLGRAPQGWFIVSPKAAVTVNETSTNTTNLVLNASASATVSIFVF